MKDNARIHHYQLLIFKIHKNDASIQTFSRSIKKKLHWNILMRVINIFSLFTFWISILTHKRAKKLYNEWRGEIKCVEPIGCCICTALFQWNLYTPYAAYNKLLLVSPPNWITEEKNFIHNFKRESLDDFRELNLMTS